MDHVLAVGVFQPTGGLNDVIEGCSDRKTALLLDQGGKVVSYDVLHYEEVNAMILTGIVGRHDIGMGQPGGTFSPHGGIAE